MPIIRNVLKLALGSVNATAQGQDPSDEQLLESIDILSGMLAAWEVEGIPIKNPSKITFSTVANKAAYTIGRQSFKSAKAMFTSDNVEIQFVVGLTNVSIAGYVAGVDYSYDSATGVISNIGIPDNQLLEITGGTPTPDVAIDSAPPNKIKSAFLRQLQNTDYSMYELSDEEYDSITTKDSSGMPRSFFFDYSPSRSDGYATIYLFPVPDSTYQVNVRYTIPFGSYPVGNLSTSVFDSTVRPEFVEAIWSNLAVRLAGFYGASVPPEVAATAMKSMSIIRSMKPKPPRARLNDGLGSIGKQEKWSGGGFHAEEP